MKKVILLTGMLAATSFLFSACNKDDEEAPVITLNGNNPFELEMLSTYVEPGYSAEDNEDGDLTSSVNVDATQIDNRLPGQYSVFYSVSDAAGNSGDATRDVIVFASTNALAKTYSVKDTCGTGASAQTYSYTQTVTAVNSTTIQFDKFADYSGNTGITATITSSGNITLPLQSALNIGSALEDHDFQGSGSVTLTGFVINYTDKNNSAVPVATASCRAWFTRQ